MRVSRIFPIVLLVVFIPVHFNIISYVSQANRNLANGDEVNVLLPSPILKITSLDYDGLVSDALYFKAMLFYGSTYVGEQQRKIFDWEYTWFYNTLTAATDLDPYFLDPYFLANGVLGWEAKRVAEANLLLAKGSHYRNWDYWLPFYLGFNYYYFLSDNTKAAEYVMQAAQKPGADPFFSVFASRLAYKGNRTENAIIFLEGVLKTSRNETMRKDYKIRIATLKLMLTLEKGVAVYKERTGNNPEKLSVLVEQHIIDRIPEDPYGGEFYVDNDGAVKTTSDLRYMKKENSKK
ncbi:MAG: hypothetical protein GJV46_10145 [Geobacter sp.]|nr:hypothetical protein [Geobacter sp.]